MIDVDQILRAHGDDAATAEPSPGAWDRLVARLDEDAPIVVPIDRRTRGPRRSGRGVLAAAAAIAAVLVVGALAIARSADDPDRTPQATVPPTTTEATATTWAPFALGPMPPSAVAVVDGDGAGGDPPTVVRFDEMGERLEVVDDAGMPITQLAAPQITSLDTDPELGPASDVDVAADGTAYVGRTTAEGEPEVTVGDVATGARRGRGIAGSEPAISADGRRLAVWRPGVGVHVLDLETGGGTTIPDEASFADRVDDLAWSPDGRMLARGVSLLGGPTGEGAISASYVQLVDLEATDPTWTQVGDGSGRAFPTFLADGRLVVGTGTRRGVDRPQADGLAVIDLATGSVESRFGGLEITGLDATADGRWILAVGGGGVLRAFRGTDLRDEGTIVQQPGIVDASW